MKKLYTFLGAMVFLTSTVLAQDILFSDDFEDGNASSRWTIGEDGANSSDFAFDYSGIGIAAAPGGDGTVGVRFFSNTDEANAAASQIMAFPTGMSFDGNYIFTCDVWMNVDFTTSGTTEFFAMGIQHTADTVPSGNGIDMLVTGEGGSSRDLRIVENGIEIYDEWNYANGQNTLDSNGPYEPYVNSWEGDYPANQWLSLKATVAGGDVVFEVNGVEWAYDTLLTETDGSVTAGNILIGYADFFSSYGGTTQFGIYDNVKVEAVTASLATLTIGGVDLEGFSPATTEYDVVLPYGSTAADLPEVAATAGAGTTVTITQATELPGDATILVEDIDGNTKTYTISFSALVITSLKTPELNVYPNPVQDILNVESINKIHAYTILDMQGKVIKQDVIGDSKLSLDTRNLKAGMYVIQLRSDDGVSTRKFIKE